MKREWKKLCKCFDSIPKPWQNIKQQKKIKRTHQVKKSNSWVASPGFSQESHYITCGLQCQNSENPQQIKIDRQYLPKHFKPNNKYCQNVFKSNWFFSASLSLSLAPVGQFDLFFRKFEKCYIQYDYVIERGLSLAIFSIALYFDVVHHGNSIIYLIIAQYTIYKFNSHYDFIRLRLISSHFINIVSLSIFSLLWFDKPNAFWIH